ncbi:hypothetical protein ACQP1O_23415 [Nocardia sp. CA-151230]|uniref:hypothetical protein n=1 Tax=Nocardia sp. CA-151230 TaxID=3239982 RepID=UPI003D925B16
MRDADSHPIFSRCLACTNRIHWVESPTGGWWKHDKHPGEDHDAVSPLRVLEEIDNSGNYVVVGTTI